MLFVLSGVYYIAWPRRSPSLQTPPKLQSGVEGGGGGQSFLSEKERDRGKCSQNPMQKVVILASSQGILKVYTWMLVYSRVYEKIGNGISLAETFGRFHRRETTRMESLPPSPPPPLQSPPRHIRDPWRKILTIYMFETCSCMYCILGFIEVDQLI